MPRPATYKKCPFCGERKAEGIELHPLGKWRVECACGVTTKAYSRKASADRRWNTRVVA